MYTFKIKDHQIDNTLTARKHLTRQAKHIHLTVTHRTSYLYEVFSALSRVFDRQPSIVQRFAKHSMLQASRMAKG
jgi:hypothetical protein